MLAGTKNSGVLLLFGDGYVGEDIRQQITSLERSLKSGMKMLKNMYIFQRNVLETILRRHVRELAGFHS